MRAFDFPCSRFITGPDSTPPLPASTSTSPSSLGDTDSTSTSSASKQQEHIQHSTPQHVATVGNGDVLNLLPDWPQSASDAAVLQGLIDLLLPEYGARWGWLHTLHFM